MEKRREFNRDSIEVCRHCKSEGYIETKTPFGVSKEKCHTCGGSGLMRKRITGTVTVEPYGDSKV